MQPAVVRLGGRIAFGLEPEAREAGGVSAGTGIKLPSGGGVAIWLAMTTSRFAGFLRLSTVRAVVEYWSSSVSSCCLVVMSFPLFIFL
jgi:hypothetical protein